MNRSLLDVKDCLSALRTPSEAARRLRPNDSEGFDGALDPYLVDADLKICPSKAWRRLQDKTQVMTGSWNSLVRNRCSHTMEVVSVATTIAQILGLNVNLARAIALGHDIGHVPFGHSGEDFIKQFTGKPFGHEIFGPIIAQKIERKGEGDNLTHQVLSGMQYHSRRDRVIDAPDFMSPEAIVVMLADKIAYTLSDYNDVIYRMKLPKKWLTPIAQQMNVLGSTQRERISTLIRALCFDSAELLKVSFKPDSVEWENFNLARKAMYSIYPRVNVHGYKDGLKRLIDYLVGIFGDEEKAIIIFCLMTDKDVLYMLRKTPFDITDLHLTSVWEQIDYILDLPSIDLNDPCLNW